MPSGREAWRRLVGAFLHVDTASGRSGSEVRTGGRFRVGLPPRRAGMSTGAADMGFTRETSPQSEAADWPCPGGVSLVGSNAGSGALTTVRASNEENVGFTWGLPPHPHGGITGKESGGREPRASGGFDEGNCVPRLQCVTRTYPVPTGGSDIDTTAGGTHGPQVHAGHPRVRPRPRGRPLRGGRTGRRGNDHLSGDHRAGAAAVLDTRPRGGSGASSTGSTWKRRRARRRSRVWRAFRNAFSGSGRPLE